MPAKTHALFSTPTSLALDTLATTAAHPPTADTTVAAGLSGLTSPSPRVRAAAARAVAAAGPRAARRRAGAAADALSAFTDDADAGVREACLLGAAGLVAGGALPPGDAVATAAAAVRCDAAPRVRSAALKLLASAATAAGATRHHPPRPAGAADIAATAWAAASAAVSDGDAEVRSQALTVLGSLSAAPPPCLDAALTAATTARTMEGVSADDARAAGGAAAALAAGAGAFVRALEDDGAAVRLAGLRALASLAAAVRTTSPAFAAAAATVAADCAADEAPAVRRAALACAAAARGPDGDAALAPLLAALADAVPSVAAAAAAAVAAAAPRRGDGLRAAVGGLLEAAAHGAAPRAALAALATLGTRAGGAAAHVAPDLMATRAGFLQREPCVDDAPYAHRAVFLLAAARAAPCVAARLPPHALAAAAVLAPRHPDLPLPAGGLEGRGRGAVCVRRPKRRRAEGNGDDAADTPDPIAAAAATLDALVGTPDPGHIFTCIARVDAALAPATRGGCARSGALRVHARALAVLTAAVAAGGALPLWGEPDGAGDANAWDGGVFNLAPLSACTRGSTAAPARLARLAALLRGVVGGGGSLHAVASEWDAVARALRVVREARASGCPPTALDAPPPGASQPAWMDAATASTTLDDLLAALAAAWPAAPVADATAAAPAGELTAPGSPHARALDAIAGLPVAVQVTGWVVATRRAWLRVDGPGVAGVCVPLELEGGGDDDDDDAAATQPPSTRPGRRAIMGTVHLPAPTTSPSAPGVTLRLALVVALAGGGRARVGAPRPLALRVAPPANANAATRG